jgi:hypothetical protein
LAKTGTRLDSSKIEQKKHDRAKNVIKLVRGGWARLIVSSITTLFATEKNLEFWKFVP